MMMDDIADDVLRQRRDAIYTPLGDAVEELQKRRRNFAGKTPGRDWLPAYEAVSAEFGLKPLVVRLTPPEEEDAPHWFWYPAELKAFVQERLLRV